MALTKSTIRRCRWPRNADLLVVSTRRPSLRWGGPPLCRRSSGPAGGCGSRHHAAQRGTYRGGHVPDGHDRRRRYRSGASGTERGKPRQSTDQGCMKPRYSTASPRLRRRGFRPVSEKHQTDRVDGEYPRKKVRCSLRLSDRSQRSRRNVA
jgi:hypothetical protein